MIKIYAIIDNRAKALVGPVLHHFRHDAPAVRMFTDVMMGEGFAKHMIDFDLWELGVMNEPNLETNKPLELHEMAITPNTRVVVRGEDILSMIQAQENRNK